MRTTRTLTALLATVIALTLAAGCGSAGDESGGGRKHGGGGKKNGGEDTLSVTDSRGPITLDGPAKKVVALEWTYAEDLLALGVTPVGVADIKGYHEWVTAGPRLGKGVKELGTRQEPSLESIRALDPDLIITSTHRAEGSIKELERIGTTLMFDPYEGNDQYAEMRSTLQKIGTAVGRADAAKQALSTLDGELEKARENLADAGKDGAEVTVARGYTTDGAAVSEIMTKATIPGALLPKLGLVNAWKAKADAYGMSTIDVEGYQQVEKSSLLYVAAKNDDVFVEDYAGNALWKRLDFVKGDRVHALDPGTWYFGGPLSTAQIASEYARALTA